MNKSENQVYAIATSLVMAGFTVLGLLGKKGRGIKVVESFIESRREILLKSMTSSRKSRSFKPGD